MTALLLDAAIRVTNVFGADPERLACRNQPATIC